MKIRCDKCGKFLKKPGALVFFPPITMPIDPDGTSVNICPKKHVCRKCFEALAQWLCGKINFNKI